MKWFVARFQYAFEGLIYAIGNDKSIFLQFCFGCITMIVSALLGCTIEEWIWIVLSICLVLGFEFINSCIEKCVDYISLEKNEQAKHIKDMSACAVLLVSIFALFVGIVILLPKVWRLFS